MNNNWQLSIKLEEKTLNSIEEEHNLIIPDDLKEFLLLHNASIPILKSFDTDTSKDETINNILDFNFNSEELFAEIYNSIKNYIPKGFFPFARDGFGNYICASSNSNIIFYNHENQKIFSIANDFQEFFESLY